MWNEYLSELGGAVIAVKQPRGKVKLDQTCHPAATGAVSGAFWGMLIGRLFLVSGAGAAIGAASGALSGAMTAPGINDRFTRAEAFLPSHCFCNEHPLAKQEIHQCLVP